VTRDRRPAGGGDETLHPKLLCQDHRLQRELQGKFLGVRLDGGVQAMNEVVGALSVAGVEGPCACDHLWPSVA
jgi:hypothetical protein